MPRGRIKNMSAEELVKEIDNLKNRNNNIHQQLVETADLKHRFHSPVMNTIYTEITPREAAEILNSYNGGTGDEATNRTMSRNYAYKLSVDMKAGNFHGDVNTIVFDDEGILMDGQTRLNGLLMSKQPCKMHVLMGVCRTGMVKMDIGRKRTNADRFRLAGEFGKISNAQAKKLELWSRMSVAAGRPDGSREHKPFSKVKWIITDEAIIEESRRLREPFQYIMDNPASLKELTWFPMIVGIAQWWVECDSAGVEQVEEAKQFYDTIKSGLGLTAGDPISVFREKMIETDWNNSPMPHPLRYALAYGWTIFTINRHTNAVPMKQLRKNSVQYELDLL